MGIAIYLTQDMPTEVYDTNITHNVTDMWRLAGVYDALYNSEGKRACAILATLAYGVEHMRNNPEKYTPLEAPNGWGTYEQALKFLTALHKACCEYPDSLVEVCK